MSVATVLYFCWIAKYGHAIFGCWTIRALKSPREHKIIDNFRHKESMIIQEMWNNNDSQKNLTQFDTIRPAFDESIVKPTAPELSFQENIFQTNSTPRGTEEESQPGASKESPADLTLDLKANLEEGNISRRSRDVDEETEERKESSSQIVVNVSIESTPEQQETQAHPIYVNQQESMVQPNPKVVPVVVNHTENTAPPPSDPQLGPGEILVLKHLKNAAEPMHQEVPVHTSYQVEASRVAVKMSKRMDVGHVEVLSPFGGGGNAAADPPYAMHIGEKLKMDVASQAPETSLMKQDLVFSTTAVQQVGTPYRPSASEVYTERAVTVVNLGQAQRLGHGISLRVGEQIYDTADTPRSDESTLIVRSIKHWQTRSLDFGMEDFEETGIDDTVASSFMYTKNDDVFLPSTPAEFDQGYVRPERRSEATPLPSAIESFDASVQTPVQTESNIVIYQPMHPPTPSTANNPAEPSINIPAKPLPHLAIEDPRVQSAAPITIYQPTIQPTTSTSMYQPVEHSMNMTAQSEEPLTLHQPVLPIISANLNLPQEPSTSMATQMEEPVSDVPTMLPTEPITIYQPAQPTTSSTLNQPVKASDNTIVYQPKSFVDAPTFKLYPEISTLTKPKQDNEQPSTSHVPDPPTGVSHFYHNVSTIEQAKQRKAEAQKRVTFEQLGSEVANQGSESDDYLTPAMVATIDRSTIRRSVHFDLNDTETSTTAAQPVSSRWKAVKDIETPYILGQPIPTAQVPYPQYNIYQPGPMEPVVNPLYGQRVSQISVQSGTSQDSYGMAASSGNMVENPLRLDLSQLEPRPPTPPTSWMMSDSQSQCVLEEIPSPVGETYNLQDLLGRSERRLSDAERIS